MGWSGRAPAPAVSDACAGHQRQGARHAEALKNSIAFVGIDIGKNSFHIVGLDGRGAIVLRQKWSRGQVPQSLVNIAHIGKVKRRRIGREITSSSHKPGAFGQ